MWVGKEWAKVLLGAGRASVASAAPVEAREGFTNAVKKYAPARARALIPSQICIKAFQMERRGMS